MMSRLIGQALDIEDRLIGQIGKIREPRHRRNEGGRTGGDDEAPGADAGIAARTSSGACKARLFAHTLTPSPMKPFFGIIGRDRFDDATDMLLQPGRSRCAVRPVEAEDAARRYAIAHGPQPAAISTAHSRYSGNRRPCDGFDQHRAGAELAASSGHTSPPVPAPITQISGVRSGLIWAKPRCVNDPWANALGRVTAGFAQAFQATGSSESRRGRSSAVTIWGVSTRPSENGWSYPAGF